MADPNNIPQQADQLNTDLNSDNKASRERAEADVASTDFDKEYDIAQANENGSGTQSSDPNPVNRKDAAAGAGTANAGQGTKSPGDSDPSDYIDMAKETTKNVRAAVES